MGTKESKESTPRASAQRRLTVEQWSDIRAIWELSPDRPSFAQAAEASAARLGFVPPAKQSITERAKKEGWERKATLPQLTESAHLAADRMVESDGSPAQPEGACPPAGGATGEEGGAASEAAPVVDFAKKAQELEADSRRKRAEVLARHRTEWQQIVALRQEALSKRKEDPADAFHRLKIAKISAEITKIQQEGEAKAWGLVEAMNDAALAAASAAAAVAAESSKVEMERFRGEVRRLIAEV